MPEEDRYPSEELIDTNNNSNKEFLQTRHTDLQLDCSSLIHQQILEENEASAASASEDFLEALVATVVVESLLEIVRMIRDQSQDLRPPPSAILKSSAMSVGAMSATVQYPMTAEAPLDFQYHSETIPEISNEEEFEEEEEEEGVVVQGFEGDEKEGDDEVASSEALGDRDEYPLGQVDTVLTLTDNHRDGEGDGEGANEIDGEALPSGQEQSASVRGTPKDLASAMTTDQKDEVQTDREGLGLGLGLGLEEQGPGTSSSDEDLLASLAFGEESDCDGRTEEDYGTGRFYNEENEAKIESTVMDRRSRSASRTDRQTAVDPFVPVPVPGPMEGSEDGEVSGSPVRNEDSSQDQGTGAVSPGTGPAGFESENEAGSGLRLGIGLGLGIGEEAMGQTARNQWSLNGNDSLSRSEKDEPKPSLLNTVSDRRTIDLGAVSTAACPSGDCESSAKDVDSTRSGPAGEGDERGGGEVLSVQGVAKDLPGIDLLDKALASDQGECGSLDIVRTDRSRSGDSTTDRRTPAEDRRTSLPLLSEDSVRRDSEGTGEADWENGEGDGEAEEEEEEEESDDDDLTLPQSPMGAGMDRRHGSEEIKDEEASSAVSHEGCEGFGQTAGGPNPAASVPVSAHPNQFLDVMSMFMSMFPSHRQQQQKQLATSQSLAAIKTTQRPRRPRDRRIGTSPSHASLPKTQNQNQNQSQGQAQGQSQAVVEQGEGLGKEKERDERLQRLLSEPVWFPLGMFATLKEAKAARSLYKQQLRATEAGAGAGPRANLRLWRDNSRQHWVLETDRQTLLPPLQPVREEGGGKRPKRKEKKNKKREHSSQKEEDSDQPGQEPSPGTEDSPSLSFGKLPSVLPPVRCSTPLSGPRSDSRSSNHRDSRDNRDISLRQGAEGQAEQLPRIKVNSHLRQQSQPHQQQQSKHSSSPLNLSGKGKFDFLPALNGKSSNAKNVLF